MGPPPPPAITARALEASAKALVAGTLTSGLFRYDIATPVTVPDRSSTLVSIINSVVPGRDVYLYRPDPGAPLSGKHPFRAARFTNATKFVLEGGPIAIYSGGTFVGEGLLSRIDTRATAFVPYSIDTRVAVTIDSKIGEEESRLIKIVRGVFEIESYRFRKTEYTVDNMSDQEATIFFRHPKGEGWKLKEEPPGTTLEGGIYFIPVEIPAKKKTEFVLHERTPMRRTIGIFEPLADKVIAVFLTGGDIPADVREKLAEALKMKTRITDIDERLAAVREISEDLSARLSEVRANLDVIRKTARTAGLRDELAKKMKHLTDELDKRTKEIVTLDEERSELNVRIKEMLREISLKPKEKK